MYHDILSYFNLYIYIEYTAFLPSCHLGEGGADDVQLAVYHPFVREPRLPCVLLASIPGRAQGIKTDNRFSKKYFGLFDYLDRNGQCRQTTRINTGEMGQSATLGPISSNFMPSSCQQFRPVKDLQQ